MTQRNILYLIAFHGIFFIITCTQLRAVEPIPPVEPVPKEAPEVIPDLVPPAVRRAAVKLAGGGNGKIDHFDLITVDQHTVYQTRIIDVATNQPVLATFMSDGTLQSITPIPTKKPVETPGVKQPEPSAVPSGTSQPPDSIEPKRPDGRDAAPRSREGLDPKDHS